MPPDELLLHAMLVCAGAAAPGTDVPGTAAGGGGSQLRRGISVQAVAPTAIVPITSSATWPERFTGSRRAGGAGVGPRLP